jgi:hypothetical protein
MQIYVTGYQTSGEGCPHRALRVAISGLPIPDEGTPWEALIQFRDDSEHKRMRKGLFRWLRLLSGTSMSPRELAEEIEWLVSEYQRYMELQRIKVQRSVFEVAIVTPLEVLENLVKFNWSKIAKSVFSVSKARVDLAEAELKAPGRECAYVVKARQSFLGQQVP